MILFVYNTFIESPYFNKGVFYLANYNDGYIYNADGGQGGFFWNGADFLLLLRLHDTIRTVDDIGMKFAMLVLNEKFDVAEQELILAALVKQTEPFDFEDDMLYSSLFTMADEFGVKEELIDLIALAYLYDNQKVLDDVRMIGSLISMDEYISLGSGRSRATFSATFNDEAKLHALASIADRYGMKDKIDWVSLLHLLYENLWLTDSEPNPRLSVSDWIIGSFGDTDKAFDFLIPFSLKMDWGTTNLQIMPEAENVTVEMAGLDGSLWEDCTYRDRLFNLVCYSEQGLTVQEKEDLKSRIVQILDTSKHKSKKLTVQTRGVSFDVKYTGLATITDAPSWLKAEIPLLAQPYGYRSFEDEFRNSGLVNNGNGDAPLGPVFEIEGPVSNPSFLFYDENYSWSGNVPNNWKLVIDFNMLTCYLKDPNGTKTNAMNKFNGRFKKIPAGHSAVLTVPSNLWNRFVTRYQTRVLW